MAKSSNQKLKMIYLMDKFMRDTDENHGITVNEMIDYLESYDIKSERKSIYNDIECLNSYGLDIVKEKAGRETVYKLVSRDFELAELKLLVDAVQSSKFMTSKKTDALIKKIEGLTSKHQAVELQRQVHVINRVKTPNEKIFLAVDKLHEAIHKRVRVEFQYTAWNTSKELEVKHDGKIYEVSPWALTWEDENYYLIGYNDEFKEIRHYRVDKMVSLKITDKERQGHKEFKNFDLPSYSKRTFGMFGGESCLVKLRVKNHLVGAMLDRFGLGTMIIPDNKEGFFTINVDVVPSQQFIGWLAGFGQDVEVVSPQDIRDKVRESIENILSLYED